MERVPCNEACSIAKTPFSQLQTHTSSFDSLQQNPSIYLIPVLENKRKAKTKSGLWWPMCWWPCCRAAVQLPPPCSAGLTEAGEPREAQLMFVSCTDGHFPSCPGVCWSPEQGMLRGGAEPSCPPAILVLHHPSPVPFSWATLLPFSTGHWH